MLCALVSPACRFHQFVDFTHLQISPTCRFHLLADFWFHPLQTFTRRTMQFWPEEHLRFKIRTVENGHKTEVQCVSRADCAGPQPRWMNMRNRFSGPRAWVKARFQVYISAHVNHHAPSQRRLSGIFLIRSLKSIQCGNISAQTTDLIKTIHPLNSPVHFHPAIFTHAFSPTFFHPPSPKKWAKRNSYTLSVVQIHFHPH